MGLFDDSSEAKVKTLHHSIFPKGTKGKVISCHFIGNTTERIYLFQTQEEINGFVKGAKSAWYLDRDLVNVIEE